MELDSTALLAAAALFATIMPDLSEVRRAEMGSETAADVHNAVMVGGATLVGVGVLLSAETNSWRPLRMLTGTAVLISVLFEVTLRTTASQQPTSTPGPAAGRIGRYGV